VQVGLALKDPSAALVRRVAPSAEERGLRVLLFPELSLVGEATYRGRDPFVSSAIALERTERMEVGTGVVGTVFHSVRHLGLRAASLAEASGGRFVLGCGVSHRAYADELGIDYPRSPLTHTRTYLSELRDVGQRLAFGTPAPVWLAALGDRMAALAGELADGLLLNWVSPAWSARTIAHLVSTHGRRPRTAVYVRLDSRERLHEQAATYLAMFANYRRHFERQGLTTAQQVADATGAPADDPEAIATLVAAYRDAGVDDVLLYPADVEEDRIERVLADIDVGSLLT
jgi:5,10-methylenetetrahydromethanopterin reductase